MNRFTLLSALMAALSLSVIASSPSIAGDVEKTVPFKLNTWIELDEQDGPVTLHRTQLEQQRGITKSSFMRPGNTEYLATVRIVLEYTNEEPRRDWEAELDIVWLDAQNKAIDGYRDEEDLDNDEHRETATVTLSTLQYGLHAAHKLRIQIDFHPD